ncbi:DNA dC-_dU-editing enzyme APOBEC-3H isoform X3 [Cebus imitator]|uniref:DNA dC->dU-editing enzyme APOBEC-3H isoform X3 n=1 Tax=Cebus imitator TaxID=2715852 RepID=UPI00080A6725|nr:DNA dC->dU-editing enzyme APOBEC-3H isoform X3 [Cebus imitator]
MSLLAAETFSLQFDNRRRRRGKKGPSYPRRAYLCYQLTPQNGSTPTRGYFENEKNRHAEICFIDEIESMGLDKTQCYEVTCYLTWSPCPSCAQKLVAFAKAQDHLNLRIFASRLYYHWRRRYKEGLQLLWKSQIPVEVMGLPEFTDCWENFVDHGKPPPFNPSKKLQELGEASRSIKRRLEKIKSPFVDLESGLRSLQLGPGSPSSSRSNLR